MGRETGLKLVEKTMFGTIQSIEFYIAAVARSKTQSLAMFCT